MSEKSSEKSEMSELAWASEALREIVAPPASAAGKMERIREASRKLKWSFSRTKDVWYADERVAIKPRELRRIEEVSGVTYGRKELRELDAIITRADALLEGQGANFSSALASALRDALGALVGTGTQGDAR